MKKSLFDAVNVKAYLEFIKNSGFPYEVKVSNYTTTIKSEIMQKQFMQSLRGKSCFAAFSKLKSDIKGKDKPVVDKEQLRYFNHDFRNDFTTNKVINIDIKSAYAYALYNNGIISETTMLYLCKIPKLDRLAAVGMLASRKDVFTYNEKNELVGHRKEVSENENFFFFAVQAIQNLMDELKRISGTDYLFTWVDGIYLKNNDSILPELFSFIQDNGYKFSIEYLTDFEVKILKETVKVRFLKDGSVKSFNVPNNRNSIAADIIYFLKTSKN